MSRKSAILLILLCVCLIDIASAAKISGIVYSFDLEKRNNSIVTINSVPSQTLVAKDGSYSFQLEPGNYMLNAEYTSRSGEKETASEEINITKEGNYVLDIVLFPSFEEEDSLFNETDEPVAEEEVIGNQTSASEIIMFIFALVGIGFAIYLILRYRKELANVSHQVKEATKELEKNKLPDEDKEVLDFIRSKGGRVTQKDIRKNFPSSEAKISLIITDLEHRNVVKKIKQGRGNVIVLK